MDYLLTDGKEFLLVKVLENVKMIVRNNGEGLGYVVVFQWTHVIVPNSQRTPIASQEGIGHSRVFQVMDGCSHKEGQLVSLGDLESLYGSTGSQREVHELHHIRGMFVVMIRVVEVALPYFLCEVFAYEGV